MNLAQRLRTIACLSIGMLPPAAACAQTSSVQDQIKLHEQMLNNARANRSVSDEGFDLITLGYLYRQAGQMQKALERLNDALTIEQKTGNQPGQAMTQNTIGRVYSDLGQQDKALGLFNEALAIWARLKIAPAQANALNNIGRAYNDLGRRDEALQSLNQALAIWHDRDSGQAGRMLSKRDMLHDMGQLKALKELNEALPSNLQEAGGRTGEANTLDNLGETYSGMGRGQEAFTYFNQALAIWRPSPTTGS